MDDNQVEQRIQAAGLNAPRITHERINALMARVSYKVVVPDGTTSTFVHAFLDDRFFLATGHSACVSPANFNAQIGRDLATSQAVEKAKARLWELEGYALYSQLREAAAKHPLDYIARIAHEVNRAYCAGLGDDSQPAWEDAPAWQRESARMGVDLHLSGDFGPEASHIAWMTQKRDEGWIYGPVKDPAKKQHPCMVPFSDLPKEQQAKDFLFRGVVHAFKSQKKGGA